MVSSPLLQWFIYHGAVELRRVNLAEKGLEDFKIKYGLEKLNRAIKNGQWVYEDLGIIDPG